LLILDIMFVPDM